jgi:hypothetical protein
VHSANSSARKKMELGIWVHIGILGAGLAALILSFSINDEVISGAMVLGICLLPLMLGARFNRRSALYTEDGLPAEDVTPEDVSKPQSD